MTPSNAAATDSVHASIARARQYSLYLNRLLTATPRLLDKVDLSAPCKVSSDFPRWRNKEDLYRSLRGLRRLTMATLIVRDLAGWATLNEVTHAMTQLAEATLRAALEWISHDLSETMGTPRNTSGEPQQLIVVGMGKLGGSELNVSSDIDLVFVYAEEGETDGTRRLSNHEYFTRVGRALIAALSELTEDGFVFRVDMRLRLRRGPPA